MVEHSAVNRVVAGSSPARGVGYGAREGRSLREVPYGRAKGSPKEERLHGQAVKTSPFHGGNGGSIPPGVILRQ